MPRRPRQWNYDRDAFGAAVGLWLRQLDRVRRSEGLPRGLSQNDFAHDAGLDPSKLSYALAGAPGRGLEEDERARVIEALERQIRWTASMLQTGPDLNDNGNGAVSVRRLAALFATADLPDLDTLRTLANLPAAPDPVAASPGRDLLAYGHWARRQYRWGEARAWYSRAAHEARATGHVALAALATAYEAAAWIEDHGYAESRQLTANVLNDLGAVAIAPETAPSSDEISQCLTGELELEAYTVVARTNAARWHVLGMFALARRAAQAGVNTQTLRHEFAYDEALADAHHFLAKAMIEEVAASTYSTAAPNPSWRMPAFCPGWRWTIHEALTTLKRERQVRQPDDAVGFAHSWRNTARALRLLLAGTTDSATQRSIANQVTEAMRQASRFTRVAAAQGPPDPLVPLWLDQARWALESRQELKRVLTPLRQSVEIAIEIGALPHASWAWHREAFAVAEAGRRGWEAAAGRALMLSLASWTDPFESRDSAKTIQLAHWLLPDLRGNRDRLRRLFDDHVSALDQLSGIPGCSPDLALARGTRRLFPSYDERATVPPAPLTIRSQPELSPVLILTAGHRGAPTGGGTLPVSPLADDGKGR